MQQSYHYENTPIQIYWKFYNQKLANFQIKNSNIFHISAQNIDCGYSLEPPRWGGSNEYPQSMFLSRNKKNNVYPCKPQFYCIKVGFKGVKIILACFRDVINSDHVLFWPFYPEFGNMVLCQISIPQVLQFEPAHDKTYKTACAPSEDSDQPGNPPSLIRVLAVHSVGSLGPKLSSCGYRRLWSDWADAQADLSLRWAHIPFCRFCHALAHWCWVFYTDTPFIPTSASLVIKGVIYSTVSIAHAIKK